MTQIWLTIRVVCVENFKSWMLINWIRHTKSESYYFVYQKNRFLSTCVYVLWLHIYVVNKLVWNVRFKSFWYTNLISQFDTQLHILYFSASNFIFIIGTIFLQWKIKIKGKFRICKHICTGANFLLQSFVDKMKYMIIIFSTVAL